MGKLTDAVQNKAERDNRDLSSVREELLRGDTKRLNCDVPTHIYKKLQHAVIERDTNITEVVNLLVLNYISNPETNGSL